ncbi:hypothetical protein RFI_24095 [Reticulomyxa filosa]|uniref:PH domain-containing protein n=1 Tax=Reticulomyxa filosa TaxID=46433 RepID=X6MHB0_RETFI|nr:hypothetical protein RFI_24095 [Reticulomyxa filosa]|eukprot:ETO13279.1 hypothetical protein RFI_24095 [Reticulomyxa filosa]
MNSFNNFAHNNKRMPAAKACHWPVLLVTFQSRFGCLCVSRLIYIYLFVYFSTKKKVELLKLTNEKHPDYNDIQNTLKQISAVNATINTRMKDFSSREQVKQVEQRFGGSCFFFFSIHLYLHIVFTLLFCVCIIMPQEGSQIPVFLFSDLLLYCTQSPTGKLSLNQKIPFDRYFRIDDVKNNRKYGSLCFEIHSVVKSFLVYADDLAEKNAWVEDIRKSVKFYFYYYFFKYRGLYESSVHEEIYLDKTSTSLQILVLFVGLPFFFFFGFFIYFGRLVCGDCSSNKLPNRSNEQQIVRVCDICLLISNNEYQRGVHFLYICTSSRDNKNAFPDLEERLKSKSWFSNSGKSPRSQDDNEEEWEDSDSDGESGAPPQEMVGVPPKSASLRRISPRRSDNPQSIAGKLGLQNESATNGKNESQHYPSYSLSEKRPSNNAMKRMPPPKMAVQPPVSAPSVPFSESSASSLPPPPDDDENIGKEKQGMKRINKKERLRGGSLSLPAGLDSNVRNQIIDMDRKYKSTIEVMQGKLEAERKKNAELQRQVKDLREENERLRKSKVDLVTWANGEINTLKKALKNQQLTNQSGSNDEGEVEK